MVTKPPVGCPLSPSARTASRLHRKHVRRPHAVRDAKPSRSPRRWGRWEPHSAGGNQQRMAGSECEHDLLDFIPAIPIPPNPSPPPP